MKKILIMLLVGVANIVPVMPVFAEVWMGQIARQLESRGTVVFGDTNINLSQQWSVAQFDHSGWFYPAKFFGSNVDVHVVPGLTDVSLVTNAHDFEYETEKALTAAEGGTVFFRGTDGYYAAWVIDDILKIGEPGPSERLNDYLNGRWYFQDNRSGDFSSLPKVSTDFTRSDDISVDSLTTAGIALVDLDYDGDLDALTVEQFGMARAYINPTALEPWKAGTSGTLVGTSDVAATLLLADVNLDSRPDLIVGSHNSVNSVYLNDQSGNPFSNQNARFISNDTDSTTTMLITDFNGDFYPDLLVGNDGQPNRLYINVPGPMPFDGVIGADVSADIDSTMGLAFGDFDNDGDADVVAANRRGGSGQVRIYFNNGTADPFDGVAGVTIAAGDWDASSVATADINGDASIDIVIGTGAGEADFYVYLNNQSSSPFSGVAGLAVAKAKASFSVTGLEFADFNKDEQLDLVVANRSDAADATSQLYLNTGTVSPYLADEAITINSEPINATSIALGDVDRDGDIDVVMATENAPDRVYVSRLVPQNPSTVRNGIFGSGGGGGSGSIGIWCLLLLGLYMRSIRA